MRTGQCLMCGVPLKKDKAALDQSRVINVTVDPDKLKNMEVNIIVNLDRPNHCTKQLNLGHPSRY